MRVYDGVARFEDYLPLTLATFDQIGIMPV